MGLKGMSSLPIAVAGFFSESRGKSWPRFSFVAVAFFSYWLRRTVAADRELMKWRRTKKTIRATTTTAPATAPATMAVCDDAEPPPSCGTADAEGCELVVLAAGFLVEEPLADDFGAFVDDEGAWVAELLGALPGEDDALVGLGDAAASNAG